MTKAKQMIKGFFMGKLYPLVLAVMIILAHTFEQELISATIIILFALLQLSICDSIRPLFITAAIFTCQVPLSHTPAVPTFSDFYFTEWRLPYVIALGAIALIALVVFVVRKKLWRHLSVRKNQLFLPMLLLAVAFLLNGLASETWSPEGLAHGAIQGAFYFIVLMLFYVGLAEEQSETELLDYTTYVALMISFVLIVQMAILFISGYPLVNGAIDKNNVMLGWVTCNPLGSILVTLIPALFLGAMMKKTGWIYFIAATATLGCAILTCSRNALLFGVSTYIACMLVAAFKAPKKWQRTAFRVVICIGVVCVIPITVYLWDDLMLLFSSFVINGTNDNGRFLLWAQAWNQFSENILFGGGFFGLNTDAVYIAVEGMPTMAHNTVLELLSSTGIVGLAAYLFYRVKSVMPLVEKPTLGKSMLGFSYLIIAVASLLDVFVFCFYTMFFPLIAMAVVFRIYDIQRGRGTSK